MNKDKLVGGSLGDLSFGELLGVAKRRKWMIILNLLLFVGAAAVFSALSQPRYVSFSQALIQGRTQANPAGTATDVISQISAVNDSFDVMTQIEILRSSDVVFVAFQEQQIMIPTSAAEIAKLPQIRVSQVDNTNVVQVAVDDTEAQRARNLADAIPRVYLASLTRQNQNAMARAIAFVENRIEGENEKLTATQGELSQLMAAQAVGSTRDELSSRLSLANAARNELLQARGAADAARAEYEASVAARQALPSEIEIPDTVSNLVSIEQEERNLATLQQERAGLLVRFTEESAFVKSIDARIASKQDDIQRMQRTLNLTRTTRNPQLDEFDARVAGAKAALDGALARLASVERATEERRQEVAGFAPSSTKQLELERQTGEYAQTIQRLTETLDALQLRNNALRSPLQVISPASPSRQTRPNWMSNLILGTALGLVLGSLLALARDVADDRVYTPDQATVLAEKEILARIPLRAKARDPLIRDPLKARAFEAYRLLRSAIQLSTLDQGVKSISVTSTRPREGKSVVAANLAVAFALEGKRVLLVDANMRRPVQHKVFGLQAEKGITDVLTGDTPLSEAIRDTHVENLRVLPCLEANPNASEVLASEKMRHLHERLLGEADLLIYDTPASFGLADTPAIAAFSPATVYVVELNQPKKREMSEATSMIEFAGGRLLGLVINKDKSAVSRLR